MSRPAKATGGAPAGARRRSHSATARTREANSGRRNGKRPPTKKSGSAPANAPRTSRCAMALIKPSPDRGRVKDKDARTPARTVLRGNPRAHAGAGGGGFAEKRDRPAGRRGTG